MGAEACASIRAGRIVRRADTLLAVFALAGCTIGGVTAQPPYDAAAGDDHDSAVIADAGVDAECTTCCEPGADSDGDGADDCAELGDGNRYTDPLIFNGFKATVGDRPEVTGGCSALDDHAEMLTRFDTPFDSMNVYAGWDFDTNADDYNHPSYGFQPSWSDVCGGRFSMRYGATMSFAEAGVYCFRIDVGATGTGIIDGKNMCAQIYVNAGTGAGQSSSWLVETGYQAQSADANLACVTMQAGEHPIDIVYWYFNIFEQAILHVRYCYTAQGTCSPDMPITPDIVHAAM